MKNLLLSCLALAVFSAPTYAQSAQSEAEEKAQPKAIEFADGTEAVIVNGVLTKTDDEGNIYVLPNKTWTLANGKKIKTVDGKATLLP